MPTSPPPPIEPDLDPASRRRARRRPGATINEDIVDPFAAIDQRPPTAHQLLGVRPGASKLAIVQGFQRAQRAAATDERRRALAAAFRKLGAQPIRTRCPYGHHLPLYALDGDTYSAYCLECDTANNPYSTYRYIGWATATGTGRKTGGMMDPEVLPHDIAPTPLTDIEIRYRTPAGERAVIFTADADLRLRLHPGDFFSILYRGDTAWTLLNHTLAESFPTDPYHRHRQTIDLLRESAETNARRRARTRA